MSEPLTKVDSAVQGLSSSPPKDKGHRHEKDIDLKITAETQQTGWKINASLNSVENTEILKLPLTTPPLKKVALRFLLGKEGALGKELIARNKDGVTINDALSAIHKAYRKTKDEDIELPYLKGFAWDHGMPHFEVHLSSQPTTSYPTGGGKKKDKKKKDKDGE
ncbi:hypothetical protein ESCO_006867 [Escovopsis weberi]|uniref:Uncharacterized protein n=1 Tax=Escovopsis weberi TaxID=150374 RepID=A0A0M9VVR8_ESCWE|nr:hypothetical protein ESCO_006867 [Escovopsis weberi]